MKLSRAEIVAAFAAGMVRLGLFAYQYYPVIDDYIQYINYPSAPDRWNDVFIGLRLYTYRPLAALFDLYVWGVMPLGAAFLIVTLMHISACLLIIDAMRRIGVPLGAWFLLVFLLLPINTEATIWLSASTRLVIPIFLSACAVWFLSQSRNGIFFVFLTFSLFFYEQCALLSLALAVCIIIIMRKWRLLALPVFSALLLAGYYLALAGGGAAGERGVFVLPTLGGTLNVLTAIRFGWLKIFRELLTNGFVRGQQLLEGNTLFILLIALSSSALMAFKRERGRVWTKLALGATLALSPYLLFILIKEPYISLRNAFPSTLGLGIMADALLGGRKSTAVLCCLVAIPFMIIASSELADYRAVHLADVAYLEELVKNPPSDGRVKRQPFLVEVNAQYHQHITNITESGWALMGAARAITCDPYFPVIDVAE